MRKAKATRKMKMLRTRSLIALALLALAACSRAPEYESPRVSKPDVGRIPAIVQDINLLHPPGGYTPPRWQPGDPLIDPGDLRSEGGVRVGVDPESPLRRFWRRICCIFFDCLPDPPVKPNDPPVDVGINTFDGIPGTQYTVPDPVGDIGVEHYVQAVNSAFQVFTRSGSPVTNPLYLNVLWNDVDSPCGEVNIIDPIVRFDAAANRWLISGFVWNQSDPDTLCIAVSRSSDPVTGGWYLYEVPAIDGVTGNDFPLDFPKLAVWADSYFMSSLRGKAGDTFLGLDAWALERSNMLAGNPAGVARFSVSGPHVALLPADLDGPPPPDGSPGFFARQVDGERFGGIDRIETWSFDIDWANTGAAKFELISELPTKPFDSVLCNATERDPCVPQPGTPQLLETLAGWPQWRLQYRNFGADEILMFNHTIDMDGLGHAGIRWYELKRSLDGAWSIAQQGDHFDKDDDPDHYFMGSIAMNGKGNMALGYTAASESLHPAIQFTYRAVGDQPGSMPGGEYVAVTGAGSQLQNNDRWGDYSTMDVDPVDDCTFWYTHEYYLTSSKAGWLTAIVSIRLPDCEAD